MTQRLGALRHQLHEASLDGLLITNPANRRYFSGFTGSAGALLVTPTDAFLVTDFRYYTQAATEAPTFTLWEQPTRLNVAILELIAARGLRRVGFEAESVTVADFNAWRDALPELEWVPTEGIGTGVRAAKEPGEIEAIRRAQAIADEAFMRLVPRIQPGKTEREIAWTFESLVRDLGAEGAAFSTIVASGPNAALPHARPTGRAIGPNEIVLIDFGARVDGYHSDCTRTLFTGDPASDPQFERVYSTVLAALAEATAATRAGARGFAIDGVARDLIAAAGHADHFGHGLGHGIGIEVHEGPSLSHRVAPEATIPHSSVVTIEPGIYLPGWGGVRIEDLVVVGGESVEILTTVSKDIDLWRQVNAR